MLSTFPNPTLRKAPEPRSRLHPGVTSWCTSSPLPNKSLPSRDRKEAVPVEIPDANGFQRVPKKDLVSAANYVYRAAPSRFRPRSPASPSSARRWTPSASRLLTPARTPSAPAKPTIW